MDESLGHGNFTPKIYQAEGIRKFCLDGKMTNHQLELVGSTPDNRMLKKYRETCNGKYAARLFVGEKLSGTILGKAVSPSKDQLACKALLIALRPLYPELGQINLANFKIAPNRAIVDNNPCVILKEHQYRTGLRHAYWVCPGMDYAILRYVEAVDGEEVIRLDIQYQESDEHGWLPSSWKHVWINPESKSFVSSSEATVTAYTINEQIPPTEFEIEFPENTAVSNLGTGEHYRIRSRR